MLVLKTFGKLQGIRQSSCQFSHFHKTVYGFTATSGVLLVLVRLHGLLLITHGETHGLLFMASLV